MAHVVVKADNLVVDDITVTRPEKFRGKYSSFTQYAQTGHGLYLQLSEVKVRDRSQDHISVLVQGTPVDDLISRIEDHITTFIHERSESFFSGKRFSIDKIRGALEKSVTDGLLVLDIDELRPPLVRDQYDHERSVEDITIDTDLVPLVSLKAIHFTKTSFRLRWTLQQARVYIEDNLNEWCITDTPDEREEQVPQVQDEASLSVVPENIPLPDEENDKSTFDDDRDLF